MPLVGFRLGNDELPFSEAIDQARAGRIPYPPAFLRAVFSDRIDHAPSASALAGCLRRFELKRTLPYYVTPESLIPLTAGNGWHALLEVAGQHESGQQEAQMEAFLDFPDLPAPFNRVSIRGKSDHIDPPNVVDYKTTGYVGKQHESRDTHRAQASVYAWLHSQTYPDAEPLTGWRIFYIGGNKATADTRGDLLPLEHTEAWIRRRIYEWAEPVSRGALPEPVQTLYNEDPKKMGECVWCELREACVSALRGVGVANPEYRPSRSRWQW